MFANRAVHDQLKGLLVLDELPISLLPSTFVKFLTPAEIYPSFLSAKWLKPNSADIEISLLFARHKYQNGKEVALYCFPEAMDRAFGIESLKAPIKTIGFLILIDIKRLLNFNNLVPEKFSAIRWARPYHLPIMIAVVNSTDIERSIGKLSQLIDYSSDMPVAWCDGDVDHDCVKQTMDMIYSYV